MAAPTSPGSLHPLTRWLTRRRSFLRLITAAYVAVYRGSGGRIGARGRGLEFLLLHTVGARSGRARTTPLLYLDDRAENIAAGHARGWNPAQGASGRLRPVSLVTRAMHQGDASPESRGTGDGSVASFG